MSSVVEKFKILMKKDRLDFLRMCDIVYYESHNRRITDDEYDKCVEIYNNAYKDKYRSFYRKRK